MLFMTKFLIVTITSKRKEIQAYSEIIQPGQNGTSSGNNIGHSLILVLLIGLEG